MSATDKAQINRPKDRSSVACSCKSVNVYEGFTEQGLIEESERKNNVANSLTNTACICTSCNVCIVGHFAHVVNICMPSFTSWMQALECLRSCSRSCSAAGVLLKCQNQWQSLLRPLHSACMSCLGVNCGPHAHVTLLGIAKSGGQPRSLHIISYTQTCGSHTHFV